MTPPVFQCTLSSPSTLAGVGVHTGRVVRLTLRPAPSDHGLVFVRTDVRDRDNRVSVRPDAVRNTVLNTEIANAAGVKVATIEHLLAALSALGVDNAKIELDGPEVPILDGSAREFVHAIDAAGRREQAAPRRYVEVLAPIEVWDGNKYAALLPADRFSVDFEIDFANPVIGRQRVVYPITEAVFRAEVATARTFGFLHEVEQLRAAGLVRGGSTDNALVIDGDRLLNPEGLRFSDEFARHKAMDAVGDLYVLGSPLLAAYEGRYAGHALNNRLVRALQAKPEAWRVRTFAPELAAAG